MRVDFLVFWCIIISFMQQREVTSEYYHQAEEIALEVLRFLEQNHGIQRHEYPENGFVLTFGKNDFQRFALRQRSEVRDHLLGIDMNRSMLFSWSQGRRVPKFNVVVYLSDDVVFNAVDGTLADRDVFVEEISHALFKISQYRRHVRKPHSAFVELIGATDKMNYQYLKNPSGVHDSVTFHRMSDRALAGLSQEVLASIEPHYYFAHKWAWQMIDFFVLLRRQNQDLVRDIHNRFYRGTDSDRIRILFLEIPRVAAVYYIELPFSGAFDPANPSEKRFFQTLIAEIGDPNICLK